MWIIIFLLMTTVVRADQIFYDKNTKEILLIEDAKAVNLSAEDKARADISDVPDKFNKKELTHPVSDYKFVNGQVVLNTKKLSDVEDRQVKEQQRMDRENTIKQSAVVKLKNIGLTDDEIKVIVQ